MLRVSFRRLAMGAYSLFMREQKSNPKLAGLAIGDRGKMLAKMYKNLSPAEMTSLQNRASKIPTPERKSKKVKADGTPKKKRAPGKYAAFVKANIGKFEKLPHLQRMSAVAKLWKAQKPK